MGKYTNEKFTWNNDFKNPDTQTQLNLYQCISIQSLLFAMLYILH